MSFSLNKLKQLLPTKTLYENTSQATAGNKKKAANGSGKVEPEVGFKLTLDIGKTKTPKEKDHPPELQVHLIGARHLPGSFGLKSVQGYMVKVKLFPGSNKYDSEIKSTSWPKFDQVFKFSLEPSHKSSFKRKKDPTTNVESPPEKFFKGNFIVFTVLALLELPPGTASAFKDTYANFKRQGSLILKQRPSFLKLQSEDANQKSEKPQKTSNDKEADKAAKQPPPSLTPSESNRNIGSVTWFLDPKVFIEDRSGNFVTDEMWLPIKELAVRHVAESKVSVQSSAKGQIELTLELCECEPEIPLTPATTPVGAASNNPFEEASGDDKSDLPRQNRISFKAVKNLMKMTKKPIVKGLCLRVTTSRMRCSIKAKESFEKITSDMYIKTSAYQSDVFMRAWKSDSFAPTLSLRWDPKEAVILVPLQSEEDLEYTNVRISIATKNKVGKKIVFGEIDIGPTAQGSLLEHWGNMINSRGTPVTMWHNFE